MGDRVYVIQVFDCVFGGQGYNRNLSSRSSRDYGIIVQNVLGNEESVEA